MAPQIQARRTEQAFRRRIRRLYLRNRLWRASYVALCESLRIGPESRDDRSHLEGRGSPTIDVSVLAELLELLDLPSSGSVKYRAAQKAAMQRKVSTPLTSRPVSRENHKSPAESASEDPIGKHPRRGTPPQDIAAVALAGGAFDWLAEEPDVYDNTSGEPL